MSQPSRPQAGPRAAASPSAPGRAALTLEKRCCWPRSSRSARASRPIGRRSCTADRITNRLSVIVSRDPDPGFLWAAPFTSVTQLTPISAFGGDIVRIRSGPGGDFGNGIYAISRGAGEQGRRSATTNSNTAGLTARQPAGRHLPRGPATGKSSVFFDLNTVVSQIEPRGDHRRQLHRRLTGLVNWYDIAFDSEGYFDGRPSMFVSSVDRTDPNKNIIYRIAADGTFDSVPREPDQRGRRRSSSASTPPRSSAPAPGSVVPGRVDRRRAPPTPQQTAGRPSSPALFFDANN